MFMTHVPLNKAKLLNDESSIQVLNRQWIVWNRNAALEGLIDVKIVNSNRLNMLFHIDTLFIEN